MRSCCLLSCPSTQVLGQCKQLYLEVSSCSEAMLKVCETLNSSRWFDITGNHMLLGLKANSCISVSVCCWFTRHYFFCIINEKQADVVMLHMKDNLM